jgi:hypothetical protein
MRVVIFLLEIAISEGSAIPTRNFLVLDRPDGSSILSFWPVATRARIMSNTEGFGFHFRFLSILRHLMVDENERNTSLVRVINDWEWELLRC